MMNQNIQRTNGLSLRKALRSKIKNKLKKAIFLKTS